MTLKEIESALDSGRISMRMGNGNLWRARRNGATKLWKTRPGEFRIPIKVGFNLFDYINENSVIGTIENRTATFVIETISVEG